MKNKFFYAAGLALVLALSLFSIGFASPLVDPLRPAAAQAEDCADLVLQAAAIDIPSSPANYVLLEAVQSCDGEVQVKVNVDRSLLPIIDPSPQLGYHDPALAAFKERQIEGLYGE